MKLGNILAGMVGALFIALVLIWLTVWIKPFDYQAVYVINPDVVVADSLRAEVLTCNQISVLKDLENKGILLTPHEYTSHISSYYSTLIAFLIGLFVLFTVGSIIGIRITSRKEIEEAKDELRERLKSSLAEELKDSKAFNESIINDILGRIEDDLLTKSDKESINDNIDNFNEKLKKMEENINFLYDLESVNDKLNEKSANEEII